MFTQKLPLHFVYIVLYSLLLAIIGCFISNALLSISSILLIICAVGYYCFYSRITLKKICIFLLSLMAFCSILWSENMSEGFERSLVKLPLLILLLPLHKILDAKQVNYIIYIIIGCCILSIVGSLINYGFHYEELNNSYLKAKVMPIYFMGDHIRFSWFLVLMMLIVYKWLHQTSKVNKAIGVVFIVVSFIFLHILASKTGLLCLYIAFIALLFYNAKKHVKLFLLISFVFASSILILLYTSKSLQNRISYIKYDLKQVVEGNFVSGLSDGARVLSCKAGIEIGNNNLMLGVGFGDVKAQLLQWHQQHHSNSQLYEIFLPTNQFIIFYSAMGIVGVVCFSIALFVILFYKNYNYFKVICSTILLIPLITDDTFERQHGVFIFVFSYLLLSYATHYFKSKNELN